MKPYANQPDNKPIFNNGQTPVGMIVHLYHETPQGKTKDEAGTIPDIDPKTGIQLAEFKATIAWPKSSIHMLAEVDALAKKTKAEAWPMSADPQAFFVMQPFFRDGDNPEHNTKNKDYLRDCYYLNFKKKAKGNRDNLGQVVYTEAPGLLGPNGPGDILMPNDIWPGCRGRVSFTMFGTEYMGKHYISVRLQNIQKYDEGNGTRLSGGGTPDPSTQFGALTGAVPPMPPALGAPVLDMQRQANGQFGQATNPFGNFTSTL